MQFGLSLPAFGKYADVRELAQLALIAEESGWDGFFIWDHVIFDPTFPAIADPWIALAAAATQTTRIKLGVMVTPLARRRPWQVARETVSLDMLSNGRLIFGAGLGGGVQWDFGFFHEEQDAKIRAQKLDEGLEILSGLWTGDLFSYDGQHYQLEPMRFLPTPVQKPRIPIWVGGDWDKPKPMQRAAKYDGYFPLKFQQNLTIAEWHDIKQRLAQYRNPDLPFDLVNSGYTSGDDRRAAAEFVQPYHEVGVTWWIENVEPWRWGYSWEAPLPPQSAQQIEERIRQGPPKA